MELARVTSPGNSFWGLFLVTGFLRFVFNLYLITLDYRPLFCKLEVTSAPNQMKKVKVGLTFVFLDFFGYVFMYFWEKIKCDQEE